MYYVQKDFIRQKKIHLLNTLRLCCNRRPLDKFISVYLYLAIYSHDNSIYSLDQNDKMQVNRCKIPTQQVHTVDGISKYHPKVNISF